MIIAHIHTLHYALPYNKNPVLSIVRLCYSEPGVVGDHVGVDCEDAGVPRPHPRQARRAQLLHPARQVRRVALARFRSIFIIYILLTMYNLLLFMKSNH